MSSNIRRRKTSGANRGTDSLIPKSLSKLSRPKAEGIRFTIWLDEQNRLRKFEFAGHAGFAQAGEDIVCAGVSALSIAAVNGLERFLPEQPAVEKRDGFLSCQLPALPDQIVNQAQWILLTMQMGIDQIQENYGNDYLIIERRRWTPC